MTKNLIQSFKYLENGQKFEDEMKSIFIIFKGLSLKQIKNLENENPSLNSH